MKHMILSSTWAFSDQPFPAFRCELWYGRNKHDKAFLPVKDVKLKKYCLITNNNTFSINSSDDGNSFLLPENEFKVIKTKEKGTVLVVPGKDLTNRVLIHAGCCGGFRGGVNLIPSANILKQCQASNACESKIEIVALLEVNQQVAFYSFGRYVNEVHSYKWDGEVITKQTYSKQEWNFIYESLDGEEL